MIPSTALSIFFGYTLYSQGFIYDTVNGLKRFGHQFSSPFFSPAAPMTGSSKTDAPIDPSLTLGDLIAMINDF